MAQDNYLIWVNSKDNVNEFVQILVGTILSFQIIGETCPCFLYIPLPYVNRQAVCHQNEHTWFLHMNEFVEGRLCQIHATIIPQRVTLCGPKSKHLMSIYKLGL